jgi:hypothetical protein
MADRRALAAAVVVAAALLGGCFGGGDEKEQPAATATPTASDPVPLTIDEPVAEKTLRAKRVGGRLQAALTVKGQAEPGTSVNVSTGCRAAGCTAADEAQIDNTWGAHVTVRAPESRPKALVKVVNAGDTSDVVFVEVRLHAKPRPAPKRKPSTVTGEPATPATPATPSAPAPLPAPAPAGSQPRTLIMIGDSLAQGTQAILPGLLPGWNVTTNADRGRPLATGMQILAGTQTGGKSVVLAFSLFTNDDPSHVSSLESAVRTSVSRAGPRGCAVWATIVRPPLNGVSYAAANRRLNQLAAVLPRLRVVPWAAAVAAHPAWVGSDGVHATPAGYQGRAQMYADAARSCGA